MEIPLLNINPKNLIPDLTAGITKALVTTAYGLDCGLPGGVNPVHGLSGLMVGTPIAALTLSSQFMYIANPGAVRSRSVMPLEVNSAQNSRSWPWSP